jgi:hypothetical protein
MSDYDTDILLWSERQAELLRRVAGDRLGRDGQLLRRIGQGRESGDRLPFMVDHVDRTGAHCTTRQPVAMSVVGGAQHTP